MVIEKIKKRLNIFMSCLKSKTDDDINEEQKRKERDSTLSDEKEKEDFFMKESNKLLVIADSNICNVETDCTDFHFTLSFNNHDNETEYIVKKSTKVRKNYQKQMESCIKNEGEGEGNEASSKQTFYQGDLVKVNCMCDHHNQESTVSESALVKCSEDDKSSGYNSILTCPSSESATSNDLCLHKDKETCNSKSLVPSESTDSSDSLEFSSLLQSNIYAKVNEHGEQEHYMGSSLRKGCISIESEVSCIESQNLKCVEREQDLRTAGTTMWLHQSQVMTDSSSISSNIHEGCLESIPSADEKFSRNNFQDIHMQGSECSITRVVSCQDLLSSLCYFSSIYKHSPLSPLQSWSSLSSLPSFGISDEAVPLNLSSIRSISREHYLNVSHSGSRKCICPRSEQLSPLLPNNTAEQHRGKDASEMLRAENSNLGDNNSNLGDNKKQEEGKVIFSFEALNNCASTVDNDINNRNVLTEDCTTSCEEDSTDVGVQRICLELSEKRAIIGEKDGERLCVIPAVDEISEKTSTTQLNVTNMVKDGGEKQLDGGKDGCSNKLSDQCLPLPYDQKDYLVLKSLGECKIPKKIQVTDGKNMDTLQSELFMKGNPPEMYHNGENFEHAQFSDSEEILVAYKNFLPDNMLSMEDKVEHTEGAEFEISHGQDSTQINCNSIIGETIFLTCLKPLFMLNKPESVGLVETHQTLHEAENKRELKHFKENAKIHFSDSKEDQEHYFNVKETMWIYFFQDISNESSLNTCEYQSLLQRLCPWIVPRKPPRYELGLNKEKEMVTCISHSTSNRVPLQEDKNNEGSHCRKGDFSAENILMIVNIVCWILQLIQWDNNRDPLLLSKAMSFFTLSESRKKSLTTNRSPSSTDLNLNPRAKNSDSVNLSSQKSKPQERGSQVKHNGQAPHKHSIRRRNKTFKGQSCALIPGKRSFDSTTRTRSLNSSKKNRKRKCHNLFKYKVSLCRDSSQIENVPNSVNTIMADFNDRNSPVCSIRRLSISSFPFKSPTSDNLTLLVSLQNSTSQSKRQVQRKPLKYQHDLSAEKSNQTKKHLVRFFQRYEATKHRHSMSQVSMEKLENMSLPEMLYKIQSIPKGLSFLREHLKISKNYQLVSIDVRPLQQQPNQPQRAEETNYQPLQQQQTVRGTDIQPIQQADEPHAADVTDLENFLRQVINGDEEAIESRMRIEWFRIITFQTYPANVGISTIKLANNGFYYTGHTIETRCYFCRQTYNEWSAESNIEAVHRQLSPDCPFINGRPTNNVPIHGGRNDPSVQDSRAAIEHLRNPNLRSPNTVALPQDQARQSPPPSTSLGASADSASVEQGSEQEPVSGQPPSKSKLKRDKKKKKKEEQAKAKAAASASQGAGGLVVHEVPGSEEEAVSSLQPEPSVTSSSSSEPGSAPGLAGGEIQPQSRPLEPSPVGGAQATSVSIAVSVPPASTQSRQSSHTSSAQNTTNTSSSASSSSATRQGGANPPGFPHGGANPPGPPQSGANPPAPTSAERLAQLDPLGINFDKPKYPAYAVYSTRLSSFDGWPSHMAQTPREMARAGYFYAGYGDYARCFFCGGGLRNWDRTDEPWMEHARWFPRCAFLRNNKGDKYVARVQRRHQEQEAGLQPSSQLPPPVERDEETAIAQALREMGYNNQIIQRAMNNWRRNLKPGRRHPPPMTASAILDIIEILESGDQENTERPGETPLTIPGIDPSAGEVNRENAGNTAESMTSLGASALEENRTDARLDNQPREYGYDQREKQEKQVLQEDFLGLTETIVCKVCCDKDVAAAFLPCGHLVCCLDCAPAMRRCPLCAELIKGTVKTYFA